MPEQGATEMTEAETRRPLPPQPPQEQSPPGLTGAMKPVPDHGEESYRGSQRLEGKKWVNVPATTKVTAKGTYSVYVQSSRVGKHQFRVAVAGLVTKPQHLEITKK